MFAAAGSAAAPNGPGQQSLPLSPPAAVTAGADAPPRGEAPRRGPPGLAFAAWPRRFSLSAPDGSVFTYALAASLAVHGLLLALRFHVFDPRTLADRGPPLEVALVNARSTTKPEQPDILAQANLDGGGNTDAKRRARTPLPVPRRETPLNDIAITTRKAEVLERRAQELISALKGAPVAPPAPLPVPVEVTPPAELPSATEATERTLEIMRLEAQIARDLDTYQKRPKRQHVGVRASEYRFARYVEDWRQKVERVGNINYPQAARDLKLYGNLILTVSIRADGSVEKVAIDRSSGQKVLDAAAIHIVEMAAPYARFPPEIRRDTEILDITRTWTFAKGDELRSD